MPDRPWIGVTTRFLLFSSGAKMRPAEMVPRGYLLELERAGALAVLLPTLDSADAAGAHLDRLDGLLLVDVPADRCGRVHARQDRGLSRGALRQTGHAYTGIGRNQQAGRVRRRQTAPEPQPPQTSAEKGVLVGIGFPQPHPVNEEQQNAHWHSGKSGDSATWQFGD